MALKTIIIKHVDIGKNLTITDMDFIKTGYIGIHCTSVTPAGSDIELLKLNARNISTIISNNIFNDFRNAYVFENGNN